MNMWTLRVTDAFRGPESQRRLWIWEPNVDWGRVSFSLNRPWLFSAITALRLKCVLFNTVRISIDLSKPCSASQPCTRLDSHCEMTEWVVWQKVKNWFFCSSSEYKLWPLSKTQCPYVKKNLKILTVLYNSLLGYYAVC